MERSARRSLITFIVIGIAAAIVLMVVFARQQPTASPPATPSPSTEQVAADTTVESSPVAEATDAEPQAVEPSAPLETVDLTGLKAFAPKHASGVTQVDPIGSLDPAHHKLKLDLSRIGAGMAQITFADQWRTARATHAAEDHYAALDKGVAPDQAPPLPADEDRYVLQTARPLGGFDVPALATHSLDINGQMVQIFDSSSDAAGDLVPVWAQTGLGRFESEIRNEEGDLVATLVRIFQLDGYDIRISQRVINRSGQPLQIRWRQFGPSDMPQGTARYIDRRRFRFGYLLDAQHDPSRQYVVAEDDLLTERESLARSLRKAHEANPSIRPEEVLWPNKESEKGQLELAWFASTNRYYALTVHAVIDDASSSRSLAPAIDNVTAILNSAPGVEGDYIFTYLTSPETTIEPGAEAAFDIGVFAGPMEEDLLANNEPYASLRLQSLILFQMSNFCAICTFQWLAHLLLSFLGMLHVLFQDWGMAIIGLVVVVRTCLHPLTKKSQIGMQRFAKQMQSLKPELDKIQKKYPGDKQKLQQEQMRLMREHQINPLQMLGCLPMFLQTPIWIALYAMLYFAFDIRHQPAFYGVFQLFNDWQFLADLSSPDRFITFFPEPRTITLLFFQFDYSSINILPFLMGIAFFLQQKYLTPPPSPNMSPEQVTQQRIMRIGIVIFMPLVLYNAPSGLVLYIMTSSFFGMLEARYIRSHVNAMDLEPKKRPAKDSAKSKDPQARAYAAAIERAKQKRKGPPKTYKKRK